MKNRNENGLRVRRCGNPLALCEYCARDGLARRVLFETKDLLHAIVFNTTHDVSHVRPFPPPPDGKKQKIGPYNGYILSNGRYMDAWHGGHARLRRKIEALMPKEEGRLIKVHAQSLSGIIFYCAQSSPTIIQLETVKALMMCGEELWFTFAFDLWHPESYDPKDGIPF